jgi:hypothetical protein
MQRNEPTKRVTKVSATRRDSSDRIGEAASLRQISGMEIESKRWQEGKQDAAGLQQCPAAEMLTCGDGQS